MIVERLAAVESNSLAQATSCFPFFSAGSNTLSAGDALSNGSRSKGRKNSFLAEEAQAQALAKALSEKAIVADDDTDSQIDDDVIPKRPTMDRTLTRYVGIVGRANTCVCANVGKLQLLCRAWPR